MLVLTLMFGKFPSRQMMWENLQIYTFLVSQAEFFIMSKNKTFGVADITVGTIGCTRSWF